MIEDPTLCLLKHSNTVHQEDFFHYSLFVIFCRQNTERRPTIFVCKTAVSPQSIFSRVKHKSFPEDIYKKIWQYCQKNTSQNTKHILYQTLVLQNSDNNKLNKKGGLYEHQTYIMFTFLVVSLWHENIRRCWWIYT